MKRIFAHIGFSAAVASIVACLIGTKLVILITLGLAVLFIASLSLSYFRRNITVPLCLGSALLSLVVFIAVMSFVVTPQLQRDGTESDISFYITDNEKLNDEGEYCYTVRASLDGKGYTKMRLKSTSKINADYYTIIRGNATLYKISDKPFDSYGYWSDGIFLTANLDDYTVTADKRKSIMPYIIHFRNYVSDSLDKLIGGEEKGVAVALVTGDKSRISSRVLNYFRYSGASHIMAVSGLHLMVVAGLLLTLLRKLRVKDSIVSPIIIALILLYIAFVNFAPSVVRAGIMMIIMVSAPLFRTSGDSLNSLGVAVFLICLNPFSVCDIGTMLSVVSTLALIVGAQSGLMHFGSSVDIDSTAKERLAARATERTKALYSTLYVLMFTLPIMYIYFGYVSIGSYISNFVIVPFGSIGIVLSILTVIADFIGIGFLTKALAFLTKYLIKFVIAGVKLLSSYSGSTVLLNIDFGFVIAGAFLIIAVCFIFNNSVLLKRGIAVAVSFCIISMVTLGIAHHNSSYLYVTQYGSIIAHSGEHTVVSGVKNISDYYDVYSYLSSRNEDIDLLVLDGDNTAISKLSQNVVVNIALTNELSEIILDTACYKDIELKNTYTVDFGDGFVLDYYYGDCLITIDGITAVSTKKPYHKADIVINKEKNIITDKKGKVDLSQGDVQYTIKDNTFNIRRV